MSLWLLYIAAYLPAHFVHMGQWPGLKLPCPPLHSASASLAPGPRGVTEGASFSSHEDTHTKWEAVRTDRVPMCSAGFQLVLVLPECKSIFLSDSLLCGLQTPASDIKKIVLQRHLNKLSQLSKVSLCNKSLSLYYIFIYIYIYLHIYHIYRSIHIYS